MKFRDLPSAIVGTIGEQIVAREYRRIGWGVIASFKFSGANDNEAPAIEFEEEGREITPDLDLSKGGKRIWLEVKTYGRAAKNERLSRIAGHDVYVHGVPVRKFENYVACEQRTGSDVFLSIVEIETREILVTPRPLSQLTRSRCSCSGCRSNDRCAGYVRTCPACCSAKTMCRNHFGMYPQFYWDRTQFEIIGRVDDGSFTVLQNKYDRHVDAISNGHAWRKHALNENAQPRVFSEPARWEWACLACDVTGLGPAESHRCRPNQPPHRFNYWKRRLATAMLGASDDEIAATFNSPIDRKQLIKMFGERWSR